MSIVQYNHQRWEFQRNILRFLLRAVIFNLLVKLDKVEGLHNIPKEGPAIILINHIAFIDPFVVIHLVPRNIIPMAKIEAFKYPIVGIFPRIWGVIPVRREEADRKAVEAALDVLDAGQIILIAAEGTRSPQLRRGKEGVAFLSSRSGAPVVPVAIDGSPGFPAMPIGARWQEPGVTIKFGEPFRFRGDLNQARREQLRIMADEAMFILAAMLPENRRGVYNDLSNATHETIEWLQ